MPYHGLMDIFYAIAEPTRRSIIEALAKKGRLSATDISGRFNVSAPAISQHLKVLREANLVYVEKQGQHRIYFLNTKSLSDMEKWVRTMNGLWNELDKLLKAKK